MAKQRIFDLPETKGNFQMVGVATGTQKDKFFEEKKTKTGKDMRMVNFGLETAKGSTNYLSLNGMERDKVYFSKRGNKEKGEKAVTEEVAWRDRNTFTKEGFKLMGVNVGVKKTINSKGEEVNDKKVLVEYDAIKEIADNLKDGDSLFTRGSIEYSTYNGTHRIRFTPSQVSLCKPVDFDAEGFAETALFTQVIIFTGVKPNDDKSEFIVSAKVVTYNTIEDVELYIDKAHEKFAKNLSKKVKPYTAFETFGSVINVKNVDEVEVDDEWGDSNKMERQNAPVVRKLFMMGLNSSTFDSETYSEDKIALAMAKIAASNTAKSEYGDVKEPDSGSDWGSDSNQMTSVPDPDEEPW